VAISDGFGNIVETYSYDVFGRATIRNADGNEIPESSIGNPYMFTGKRLDAETGLYYQLIR